MSGDLSLVERDSVNVRFFGAAALAVAGVLPPAAYAAAPQISPARIHREAEYREHPDLVALRAQMLAHPKLPSVQFWYAVARCETGLGLHGKDTWARGAHWRKTTVTGALGIATSAWLGFQGGEFAPKAALASRWAQMIVANRIGFLGAQTDEFLTWEDRAANKPFYRPAAGFKQGWGGKCRVAHIKKAGGKP